ncbi:MAG: hypothetical protein IPJ18_22265 [Betaproteobacteria bacterium]|nr:hypothetical protein [Betaproteobacteria bacterium]
MANSITDSVSAVEKTCATEWSMTPPTLPNDGAHPREAIGGTTSHLLSAISNAIRKKALRECIEEQEVRVVRDQLQFPGQAPFMPRQPISPMRALKSSTDESARCVVMVTRDISAREHPRQQLCRKR